ncbi:MAG: sigma-70 family RNA polymerase sigma factor [Bacteroidetes bacterium]|nr:sigma-70 family RNA polymerase sigma factor [Bacteroidota bacterium]
MNLETSAVIEAIKAGSEKILFQLYENYRNEFIHWAVHNHRVSVEEAKDVFQEALIGLYRNVKSGRVDYIEVSIKTYLFSIGKNVIMNGLRRKGIEARVYESLSIEHDNAIDDGHKTDDLKNMVKRLYMAIGSPCKEILEMYYERGFDMETIADRIGYKNANVAKKRKYECLKALEERIRMSPLAKEFI